MTPLPRRPLANVLGVRELGGGLGWPEGPTRLADGRIAFVEAYRGRISVWAPGRGIEAYADVGGGPNAALLAADGALLVTQNGGTVGPWRSADPRPPSIQRVSPSGRVEIVATEVDGRRLIAPNDLAFGPDGRLYFTDPGGEYEPVGRPDPGFLYALRSDGTGELLAELPPTFPNGIAVEADGCVVWVESYTRAVRRRRADGRIEDICVLPEGMVPDGFKIGADGAFYIAVLASNGVAVVAPDGAWLGLLPTGGVPTNCVFDGATLYVTDAGHLGLDPQATMTGRLLAVDLDGVEGQPPFPGRIG